MWGFASEIVGWGPVHLMPARRMRPLPPYRYRLHSAACAPAPAPGAADPAAAGAWALLSGCAEMATSRQERMASQPAAAAAVLAQLHLCSRGISREDSVSTLLGLLCDTSGTRDVLRQVEAAR
jgi:hypothetical protein